MNVLPLILFSLLAVPAFAGDAPEKDIFRTSGGDLKITFIGHGSLMLRFNGRTLHVDPFSRLADYSKLTKADLLLITHEHQDHLDPAAVAAVRAQDARIILCRSCTEKHVEGTVMQNGDVQTVFGIRIEAVPAYNLLHKREDGQPYHPRGQGNGYIVTFADKRVYIAGDTENTPEMKALRDIDIAFLPMNLPYTMTPEMVADAARAFNPKVLYPYHFGDTDSSKLVAMLADRKDIEVRIRGMR